MGQNISSSGIVGQNVKGAVPALAVWARSMNEQGGIACHPVQVISLDDGSNASRATQNVRELANRKAAAIVASYVPISFTGFRAGINQVGIPAVGGDQALTGWNEDPLLYSVGAGAKAYNYAGMAQLAAEGKKKIAVIYCVESSGCSDFRNAVVETASIAGAEIVYDAQVSLTQLDYTAECQNAKQRGATQFVVAIDGSGVQRVARSCLGIGLSIPLVAPGVAAGFNTEDPNVRATTVTLSGSAWPWVVSETAAQKAFHEAMKKYAPSLSLTGSMTGAWASGMMLKTALEKLGNEAVASDITPALVKKGLALIKNEDLGGLVAPTSYIDGQPSPLVRCSFIVRLGNDGQWKAPLGNKSECLP